MRALALDGNIPVVETPTEPVVNKREGADEFAAIAKMVNASIVSNFNVMDVTTFGDMEKKYQYMGPPAGPECK